MPFEFLSLGTGRFIHMKKALKRKVDKLSKLSLSGVAPLMKITRSPGPCLHSHFYQWWLYLGSLSSPTSNNVLFPLLQLHPSNCCVITANGLFQITHTLLFLISNLPNLCLPLHSRWTSFLLLLEVRYIVIIVSAFPLSVIHSSSSLI